MVSLLIKFIRSLSDLLREIGGCLGFGLRLGLCFRSGLNFEFGRRLGIGFSFGL